MTTGHPEVLSWDPAAPADFIINAHADSYIRYAVPTAANRLDAVGTHTERDMVCPGSTGEEDMAVSYAPVASSAFRRRRAHVCGNRR